MRQYVDETASEKAHSAYTEAEVETEDSQCHLRLFSRALVSGETTSTEQSKLISNPIQVRRDHST